MRRSAFCLCSFACRTAAHHVAHEPSFSCVAAPDSNRFSFTACFGLMLEATSIGNYDGTTEKNRETKRNEKNVFFPTKNYAFFSVPHYEYRARLCVLCGCCRPFTTNLARTGVRENKDGREQHYFPSSVQQQQRFHVLCNLRTFRPKADEILQTAALTERYHHVCLILYPPSEKAEGRDLEQCHAKRDETRVIIHLSSHERG